MVVCSRCYSVNLDTSRTCGVCGAALLQAPFAAPVAVPVQRPFRLKRSRVKGIVMLGIGIVILALGVWFLVLPIEMGLTGLGFFIIVFGATFILAILGVFSGTPYKGRYSRALNRTDRYLKRRERRKQSD